MDLSSHVVAFYRYPVKSLPGERLEDPALLSGVGLAGDRRFAIAPDDFDPGTPPQWHPKRAFHVLREKEQLARLTCLFNDESETLSLTLGEETVSGVVSAPEGCAAIESFISNHPDLGLGPVKLIDYGSASVKDAEEDQLSLCNLASVRALSQSMGVDIDPVRFRSNVWLDGLEPFAEFDWVGSTIRLNGAHVRVLHPTVRCAAVNVNPTTAKRDINLVKGLSQHLGHVNMAVSCAVE